MDSGVYGGVSAIPMALEGRLGYPWFVPGQFIVKLKEGKFSKATINCSK